MKNGKWLKRLLVVGLITLLGACGGSGGSGSGDSSSSEEAAAKSDEASIKVKDGVYIIPNGETENEEEGFLALSLTIKNESKNALNVSSEDISLYDEDDNKIALENVYDSEGKIKTINYTTLSGGKTLSGYVVFQVDKDAEYKLVYQPVLDDFSEELADIEMKVDAADYDDNSENIRELVHSFVGPVFMEDEAESKTKLTLANNLEEENQAYKEKFSSVFKKEFDKYEPSDDELNKVVEACIEANREKAEVTYTISEMFPTTAIVYVAPKTIQFRDLKLYDMVTDYMDEKRDTYENYDYDLMRSDGEKNMAAVLPDKIKETATRAPDHMSGEGYSVKLTFKDDAWTVDSADSKSNYDYKYLQEAFMGGLNDY